MGVLPPAFKGIVFVITELGEAELSNGSPLLTPPFSIPPPRSKQERIMKYCN